MIRSTVGLLLLAVAFNSQAQVLNQPVKMSPQMVLLNAPVPSSDQPQRLVLKADKPGDTLITEQRKSLVRVKATEILLSADQIKNLYSNELAKQLGADEAEKQIASGYAVYGNFMNGIQGRAMYDKIELRDKAELYQIVILNSNKVQKTILQMEWFNEGIGGHAQLRFKTSQPFLLISQENPSRTQFIKGDVVYGLMAVRTENGSPVWGAATSLTGAFANAYALSTPEHMAGIQLNGDNGSFMEQYEMNLTEQQSRNLFLNAINTGTAAREREVYNLVFNNCVQAVMRALKTVENRVDGWEFNPYQVLPQLKKLNLIGPQLVTANAEFNSPVQALKNSKNEKNLALVAQLQPAMNHPAFNQSLRVLAATLIQDGWKADELNTVFTVAQQSLANANAGAGAQVDHTQVIAQIKAALEAQSSSTLTQKTEASIQKVVQGLAQVLIKNKISLDQLVPVLNELARAGGN